MGDPISFGAWLRRRRKALDLTQVELAQHTGCVVGMIKSIEGDTRRPSKHLAERLASILQLVPEERTAFLKAARGLLAADQVPEPNGVSPTPRPTRSPAPLPAPLTTLIGRERELAELHTLLADPGCRLVTIVGPGGIGKTRLALEAAASNREMFAGRAVFVSLAAVENAAVLAPTILLALGVPLHGQRDPFEQVRDVLHSSELLLVLDNFEQLLANSTENEPHITALVVDLLWHAPGVKLLVTSRERLGVAGEWLIDLAGLYYPATQTDEKGKHSSAVQLFVQRARQARRSFALTNGEAEAVARICRLVEGMPLAIELAASGLRSQSATAIADALECSITGLATTLRAMPERHRSIVAALEHSWRLLSDAERQVFAWLSVFRGGFEEDAAASVAGATPEVLAALLDKSLVRWDGANRYDLHELLRQYASEKLSEIGEAEQIGDQHLTYYSWLAEQAGSGLYGPQQITWRHRLDAELGNLRAALAWSLEHDVQAGLRLAGALDCYWEMYRPLREGIAWLEQLLRHPGAALPNVVRAKALLTLGGLQTNMGASTEGHSLTGASLALYQSLGDELGIARALFLAGVNADDRESGTAGAPYVTESLARFKALGDLHGIASAQAFLGGIAYRHQRDYAQARTSYEAALTLLRELGDIASMMLLLSDMANLAAFHRDFAHAHACLDEADALAAELRAIGDWAGLHGVRGQLALREGRYAQAQAAFEEGLALNQASGNGIDHWITANLGYAVLRQGDLARAYALFAEATHEFRTGPETIGVVYALEGMAGLAVMLGQAERAVRLYAWADSLRAVVLDMRPPVEQDEVDRDFVIIRNQLDAATLEAARAKGQELTMEQAITEALQLSIFL
jgi:predicted ATPase/transcriptional regulator with XRE-family HTH domain